MIGIYKITSPSGKVYIGQSVDIKRRLREYKNLRCTKQVKLYNSFLKYGFEYHKIEVVCECLINELNDKERCFQDLFDSMDSGLNCYLTKSSDKSGKLSLETKKKLSIANSNPSDETRRKKSIGQIGKTVPLEMRKKISESHKGIKHSMETRLKIAENSRNISDETRKKYSESHIGHKHTDEAKKKISEAGKGRIFSENSRLKIASKHGKRVLNKETGEIYLSITKAALDIKHNVSWLVKKLNGDVDNNTNLIYA